MGGASRVVIVGGIPATTFFSRNKGLKPQLAAGSAFEIFDEPDWAEVFATRVVADLASTPVVLDR